MHLIWEQINKFVPDIDRESDYGKAWIHGMQALGRAQDEDCISSFREAGEAFVKALEVNSERPEALLGLAYLFVLLGDDLSAAHYAHGVLDHQPAAEARELLELLESSHRINSLLEDVERLFRGAGLKTRASAEVMTDRDASRLVEQTEMLLQVHHALLVTEINQGMFKRIDQLNSRQRSLETLFEMLSAHLSHFLEDQQFGERLQKRLDVLAFDLESLQNLENLFDELRKFQKEVQSMFRELTRHLIQLRMKKENVLADSLNYLHLLKQDIQTHARRLDAFPAVLRTQVESASGWNHLKQQADQLDDLIQATILAVG